MMGILSNAKLLVVGGVGLAVVVSQVDLAMNYTEVEAKVTSVKVDCYVKNSDKKLVDKKTNDMAYMPCDMAKLAAKQFGYKDSDVRERAALKLAWVSPVDGRQHTGEHTDDYATKAKYKVGGKVKVYAHTSEADDWRWN